MPGPGGERSETVRHANGLQRLEANDGAASRYSKITYWRGAIDELLVKIFLEAHAVPPQEIVIDIDTTDVELHGGQEGRSFHGYYHESPVRPIPSWQQNGDLLDWLRSSYSEGHRAWLV